MDKTAGEGSAKNLANAYGLLKAMRTVVMSMAISMAMAMVAGVPQPLFAQDLPPFLSSEITAGCQPAVVSQDNGRAIDWTPMQSLAGFARHAGVTGGIGQPVLSVTSTADIDPTVSATPPPGTLRALVEQARRQGGGWITFAPTLPRGAHIRLVAPLRLPSNLTLDGGCSGITLTAAPDISILMVGSRVSNLIVARLQFEKQDPTPQSSSGDCISVGQDADRVWIAWNSLRNCGDGAVDITQSRASNTPTRVTVAFNRFAQHDKVMLNATLECFRPERTPDCVAPLERGWNWSRGVQVTLQGNVFLGTGQRHPRMAGLAYTHMLDNVVAFRPFLRTSGESGASYGSFVGAGARGLFENNLYLPLGAHARHRAITSNGDLGVAPSRFDGGGAVRSVGNVALRQASVEERHPELVPLPPYQLSPRRHFSNPERGARCALALSGPWAPLRTPPPECQE